MDALGRHHIESNVSLNHNTALHNSSTSLQCSAALHTNINNAHVIGIIISLAISTILQGVARYIYYLLSNIKQYKRSCKTIRQNIQLPGK